MVRLSMLATQGRLHGALIGDVVGGFRMVAFQSGPRSDREDNPFTLQIGCNKINATTIEEAT